MRGIYTHPSARERENPRRDSLLQATASAEFII